MPMNLLHDIPMTNGPGNAADLVFLQDERWLHNSAVNHWYMQRQGRWHIYLVMAHVANPYRLICRYISHCPSRQKAEVYAAAYLRTAQKDERGSLKINYDDFIICPN
jgi:hypothetical protein